MTIGEAQDEIIDEFAFLDSWEDKYEYIIDVGKKLPPMPDALKTEANKIKGCQSQVWIHPEKTPDGSLAFEGDSDSTIVRGLVALVLRALSGHKPEEIASANLYFPEKIGMDKHLAPTRSNGLAAMVKQIKLYGQAYAMMGKG